MPSRLRVRRATLKDMDVLVHQRHSMFEEMRHRTAREHRIGDESYRRWAGEMMKSGRLRCFLVTSDRQVVAGGCVWLRPVQPMPGHDADAEPYLLSMYTEPSYRGKGLASMIVKESKKWARKRGYTWMTLHASKAGRKVYTKLGWKRTWEMEVDL